MFNPVSQIIESHLNHSCSQTILISCIITSLTPCESVMTLLPAPPLHPSIRSSSHRSGPLTPAGPLKGRCKLGERQGPAMLQRPLPARSSPGRTAMTPWGWTAPLGLDGGHSAFRAVLQFRHLTRILDGKKVHLHAFARPTRTITTTTSMGAPSPLGSSASLNPASASTQHHDSFYHVPLSVVIFGSAF